MTTVNPVINDHITRAQLRLVKEQIDKENEMTNLAFKPDLSYLEKEKTKRLKEVINQREDLLKRIKKEQQLNYQIFRPQSEQKRIPERPLQRYERRAESLPPLNQEETSYLHSRHKRLDQQPLLVPQLYQPQFVPSDPAQFIVPYNSIPPTGLPLLTPAMGQQSYQPSIPLVIQPYVIPASHPNQQDNSVNNRTDMYGMMMMQSAQMHQLLMQQMMFSNLPKPERSHGSTKRYNSRERELEEIRMLLESPIDDPPKVVHHHYSLPRLPVLPTISSSYPYHVEPLQPPTVPRQLLLRQNHVDNSQELS